MIINDLSSSYRELGMLVVGMIGVGERFLRSFLYFELLPVDVDLADHRTHGNHPPLTHQRPRVLTIEASMLTAS